MTTETEPSTAPKPRARPPARRPASNGNADLATQLAALQAKIEQLERGGMHMVASETPPVANARVADPEELTPFVRDLRAGTHGVPPDYQRDPTSYNFPTKLYCKPDGSIVSLQGDPGNETYYRGKGYSVLTPDQERAWLSTERRKVVRLQQQKAALINDLTRLVALDPVLKAGLDPSTERDWSLMTVAELQLHWDQVVGIPTASGQQRRTLPRLKRLQDRDDRQADAESERMLAGVELTPSRAAREAFEQSLPEPLRQVLQPQRPRSSLREITAANAAQFSREEPLPMADKKSNKGDKQHPPAAGSHASKAINHGGDQPIKQGPGIHPSLKKK